VLGLKPIIGQFFTAENHLGAADKVLVLTQSFWELQFQEDPGVLGKTVRLDGETFTIVGVAPRAFEAFYAARVRFVRPLSWDPARVSPNGRHSNSPALFGRLKPDIPLGQAIAEAETIERRALEAAPPPLREFVARSGHKIVAASVQFERVQPMRTTLFMLQGGVVLVLLTECVNVANLLLARANARQSELAIRSALGATRGGIARQLMLEGMLITALGTALGLAVAAGLTWGFNHYRAQMMPDALPFALDANVLGLAIAVSVVTSLLISIVPIVHILRTHLVTTINSSSRGSSGSVGVRTLSSVLIVGQVAAALMLLCGAGLLIHSFMKAIAVNPGFDPRGVFVGRMAVPRALGTSPEARRTLETRVKEAMEGIPGVTAMTFSMAVPFQGGGAAQCLHPLRRHPAAGLAAARRQSRGRVTGVFRNTPTHAARRTFSAGSRRRAKQPRLRRRREFREKIFFRQIRDRRTIRFRPATAKRRGMADDRRRGALRAPPRHLRHQRRAVCLSAAARRGLYTLSPHGPIIGRNHHAHAGDAEGN